MNALIFLLGVVRFVAYWQLYTQGVSFWWFVLAEACVDTVYLACKIRRSE